MCVVKVSPFKLFLQDTLQFLDSWPSLGGELLSELLSRAFSCVLVLSEQGFPAPRETPALYSKREKWGGGGVGAAGKLEETRRDKC